MSLTARVFRPELSTQEIGGKGVSFLLKSPKFELGAEQQYANVVCLETCHKLLTSILVFACKNGIDTTENEPPQVCSIIVSVGGF